MIDRRVLLMLAALAATGPSRARAEWPPLVVTLSPGVHTGGSELGAKLGLAGMMTIGLDRQIFLGVLASASRHTPAGDGLGLGHLAGLAVWRLDVTPIVPQISLSLGALRGRIDERYGLMPGEELLAAYTLAFGFDWWPVAPFSRLSLGAEIRYLGLVGQAAFPALTQLDLRVGWGF